MVPIGFEVDDAVGPVIRLPDWTPCSEDPEDFDCEECEIGWTNCRLRLDESLRHSRAVQKARFKSPIRFSRNEERDLRIESETVEFLQSHGIAVNGKILLEYLPKGVLGGITAGELDDLLHASGKFVESSPGMFKLAADPYGGDQSGFVRHLPISSGTELQLLLEASPPLSANAQLILFKHYRGLRTLSSFDTRQQANISLDSTISNLLDSVSSRRGWSLRTIHRLAVGPDSVPTSGNNSTSLSHEDFSSTSELLSAISASEICTNSADFPDPGSLISFAQDLVLHNLRLVAKEARANASGGFLAFSDLFQVGAIGLMTAIDRFDPYRGYQFSTYATYWIKQSITREISNTNRTVRLPVHMVEQLNAFLKEREIIYAEFGRPPTVPELASELGLDSARVRFLLELSSPIISLEHLLVEDGGAVIDETQNCGDASDALWVAVSDNSIKNSVGSVLSMLSPREEKILKLRFGIECDRNHTLEEIGGIFGITRERVRQIESKAIGKMRKPPLINQLSDLL